MMREAMMTEYVLPLADTRATLAVAGGKGASLARLSLAGLPVPPGFHVTTEAYERFVAENNLRPGITASLATVDPEQAATLESASAAIRESFDRAEMPSEVARTIEEALESLPQEGAVAVRSSATAEDLPELSFAGQQDTYLNVAGTEAVLQAVKRCWASLWTARAIGYRMQHNIDHRSVSLAVVVQLLVPAKAAGVLFTAHPISGRRDQAMITATWGLGEAIVGGQVTPDTLVVAKATGRVLERDTAEKQVMTVRVAGGTEEQPVPEALQNAPVLDDDAAAELVELGVRIEELYGCPMDVEWALADGRFAIVQARPITALPEPEAVLPAEWPLPDPQGRYLRVSITELLPDPLTPLFESLGLRIISRGVGLLLTELLGMPAGAFGDNMFCTINGYAYQRASFSKREWWLMITRMLPRMPRMLREGVSYWQNVAQPRYARTVAGWSDRSPSDLKASELLEGVREVMVAFAYHLGALMTSTMGPSAGSEGLFTRVYDKLARRPGDPAAPAFLMGFDSQPIRAEKALYDLALWCREQPGLSVFLLATPAAAVAARLGDELPPPEVPGATWAEWRSCLHDYLERYGSSIYSMDFAHALPADDPEPVLETLKLFVSGQGRNPYERQRGLGEQRKEALASARARLRGPRRWAFEKALRWAQSQVPLREDGIAAIGLGFPLLRRLLRELGRRCAAAGMIERPDDVFWLEETELAAAVVALDRGKALPDCKGLVRERNALWNARRRATPPMQLPPKDRYLGIKVESLLSAREGGEQGDVIRGVGASAGRVTGRARVLAGPEDFGEMERGDVLVARITTPAWTPLFALASAVVTDIGGPLSHGSIVAREYRIPAVLGTGVATKRIGSGQIVTVDGSAGTVILLADKDEGRGTSSD